MAIIVGINVRPNMEKVEEINQLVDASKELIRQFIGKDELAENDVNVEIKDLAFGIKELNLTFMAPNECESEKLEALFEGSEYVENMGINRFELPLG